jgi:hypothetical protein
MVDLRPDPTVTDGFALVAGNGIVSLADAIASDPGDTIGPVVRTLLGNKLGLTLQSATIKDVLAELLFRRGNKWNPCAASLSRKIKEIYIGGELWASMPFDPGPQGDTDPSDNFSGTDANPIGGNWTTTSGLAALRRISNQLANAGSDADSGAWWNAATFSSDHWSEITFAAVGSASDCGPAVRCQSGAATFYCAATYNPGEAFYKMVSGTASAISGVTTPNAANGDTVRCEAEGSTIRYKKNGAEVTGSPITDTSIPSGGAPGVFIFEAAVRISLWTGADIAANAFVPSAIGWRNRQNPRLRGPSRQSRFQRTQLWSTPSSGQNLTVNVSDSISFSDSPTKADAKPISDAITLGEALAKQLGKPLADSVTMNDARALLANKALADSVTVADAKTLAAAKALADALSMTDARALQLAKVLSDSITVGDSSAAFLVKVMSVADSIAFSEGRTLAALKVIADAITVADARALRPAKAFVETIGVTDGRINATGKTLTENIHVADSFSFVLTNAGEVEWLHPLTTVFQDAGMETQIDQSLMATVIHATEMTTEVMP